MKKLSIPPIIIFLLLLYACEKKTEITDSAVAINELMPVNNTVVSDPDGDFDDWIELYNMSSESFDLSGCFLSDNEKHISKWQFPASTKIEGKGYLIIWADDDSSGTGLHTNFKLSSLGEEILLSDPDGNLIDKVLYPGQSLELSYSRNPDGEGAFIWQIPTFARSNNSN
ncbi:MAG: lamin tail domain-containing protein [Bacteroidia bacterium]|nr:lamin tail domain-containing protein [Bacteroidia bacterium]